MQQVLDGLLTEFRGASAWLDVLAVLAVLGLAYGAARAIKRRFLSADSDTPFMGQTEVSGVEQACHDDRHDQCRAFTETEDQVVPGGLAPSGRVRGRRLGRTLPRARVLIPGYGRILLRCHPRNPQSPRRGIDFEHHHSRAARMSAGRGLPEAHLCTITGFPPSPGGLSGHNTRSFSHGTCSIES